MSTNGADQTAIEGVSPSTEATTPATAPAVPRPFLFDTPQASGKRKFSVSNLQIAGLLIGAVLIGFLFLGVIKNSTPDGRMATSKPFSESHEDITRLKSFGGKKDGAPATVEAPKVTTEVLNSGVKPADKAVESTALSDQTAPASPTTAALGPKEEASPPAPPEIKKKVFSKPFPVNHVMTVLAIKEIDEAQVIVGFDGHEYLVRSGEKLPGGDTVFIGYDRVSSVMRTSSGDHRIRVQ